MVTRGKDHRLALGRLGALVEQLEALSRSGRHVILVTSGSVSVGRQKLRHQQILNSSPLEMTMEGRSSGCSESFSIICISELHDIVHLPAMPLIDLRCQCLAGCMKSQWQILNSSPSETTMEDRSCGYRESFLPPTLAFGGPCGNVVTATC